MAKDDVRVEPSVVARPDGGPARATTGLRPHRGLHAAGLFTSAGEVLAVREDVGCHNAVDKVVGWAGREGRIPLAGQVLVVSGRASHHVQKAVMAGIPPLVSVSAPTSLAVEPCDGGRAHARRIHPPAAHDGLLRGAPAGAVTAACEPATTT